MVIVLIFMPVYHKLFLLFFYRAAWNADAV